MDINKVIKKEIHNASELIADRGESYGNAIDNHKDICDLENVLLRDKLHTNLTETDVILKIIAIKMARLMKSPDHIDSWQDIICYAGIAIAINKTKETQDEIIKTMRGFQGNYKEQLNGSSEEPQAVPKG